MSAQDALWIIPSALGPWWSGFWALGALGSGLVLFWYLVFKQPFNALLVARTGWIGALVCVVYNAFNSGGGAWVIPFVVSSSVLWAVLMVTGWCERENQQETMAVVFWRYLCRGMNRLAGPYKAYFPDDTWRKL